MIAASGVPLAGAAAGNKLFSSPWDGSHITGGKVIITGRLASGRSKISLYLNGRPIQGASVSGSTFSAIVTPKPGTNIAEAKGGGVSDKVTFTYGSDSRGKPVYRFHGPLLDGECRECHQTGKKQKSAGNSGTCYGCHDSWDGKPFLHGPVGAGECLFCHDPHGSTYPALSRHEERKQCFLCHDQPSSRGHVNRKQNENCNRCHDPHGGKDQNFLK